MGILNVRNPLIGGEKLKNPNCNDFSCIHRAIIMLFLFHCNKSKFLSYSIFKNTDVLSNLFKAHRFKKVA